MPDQPQVGPAVNPWLVATSVIFATFMEVLDTTVVNVSLPHIAGSLSATPDEATWALTSYLVANAIVLPITGWLANQFGRKRLLLSAVTGFTAASVLCGLAPNLGILIAFRVVQGATGGALQPLSQAVMLEAFPSEERGKAMAFWGLGVVVAPMLGPVLGGWLTDNFSWRWVFYINVPVGILGVVMMSMFIVDPSYIRKSSNRIDYWGTGMLSVGIAALQIVLDKGQEDDWFSSHLIVVLCAITLVFIPAFVAYELAIAHPVVNLRAFKDRTYATGVFLMTMLGFVLYGSLVLLPIWLQTLMEYPALQAGLTLFPRGLGAFISMPVIGVLLKRVDARKLILLGIGACAYTLVQLSWLNLNAGYWDFFWPQFFQGVSMALLFVPLTTATMDPIPNEQMGNATSIFNVMRNLGGSIGIAVATTLVFRIQQQRIHKLVAHVTPYDRPAQQVLDTLRHAFYSQGMGLATAAHQAYEVVFGMVEKQAAIQAFLVVFRLFGMSILVVSPIVFLMKRPTRGSPQLAETGPTETAGTNSMGEVESIAAPEHETSKA